MVAAIAVRARPPVPADQLLRTRPAHADPAPGRAGRRAVGVVVTAVAIAVGVYAVRDQLPSLTSVIDLLASARVGWLGVALVATAVSVLAFALIQRRLVTDLGGTLGTGRSVEITLTSGAISMALPAGSALGAGYTYRRLRRTGLGSADTGVSMVGSAGLLTATLVTLYLAVTGPGFVNDLADAVGANAVTAMLVLLAVLAARAVRPARRSAAGRGLPTAVPVPATGTLPAGRIVRLGEAIPVALRLCRHYLRSLRITAAALPGSTWRSGAGWAAVKWTADFGVLAAAVLAVGADVDLLAMASIYVAVQVLRQVPITPGGVGVIEAALLAGLVAAGAAAAPATAAVVIYRGLTFWLTLAAGAACALLFPAPADAVADDSALPMAAVRS